MKRANPIAAFRASLKQTISQEKCSHPRWRTVSKLEKTYRCRVCGFVKKGA